MTNMSSPKSGNLPHRPDMDGPNRLNGRPRPRNYLCKSTTAVPAADRRSSFPCRPRNRCPSGSPHPCPVEYHRVRGGTGTTIAWTIEVPPSTAWPPRWYWIRRRFQGSGRTLPASPAAHPPVMRRLPALPVDLSGGAAIKHFRRMIWILPPRTQEFSADSI